MTTSPNVPRSQLPADHHHHTEQHRSHRVGWLRAAVLGANDGVVSTAALIVGVAGSGAAFASVRTAGIAGLVAGAMSMAAGEYVSVASQRDVEEADLAMERAGAQGAPSGRAGRADRDLARPGLDPDLAAEVARQLTEADALGAHARDELGLTEVAAARPVQAAVHLGGRLLGGRRSSRCSPTSLAPDNGRSAVVVVAALVAPGGARRGRRRPRRRAPPAGDAAGGGRWVPPPWVSPWRSAS